MCIRDSQRLQPALGMHAKQRVVTRAVGMPGIAQCGEQLQEERPIAVVQQTLFRADSKNDVLLALQGDGLGDDAGASELQAAPAECDLSRRKYGHLATRQDLLDTGNG